MTRPLILLVDDEVQILRFLGHALSASGYDICTASRGAEALAMVASHRPDLLVLDLGLPDMDGKTVIETLRQTSGQTTGQTAAQTAGQSVGQTADLPIIVLSARDQEMEKIMALDLGADDFVAKPFAIGELLARLRVCLRPRRRASEPLFRLGPLAIDPAAHRVTRDGQELHLTPKEFDLLSALAESPGRVLTHRQLLSRIWGPAHVEDVPYLRVFIGQLRQKVETDPARPQLILTEPGIGYRGAGPA